MLFFLFDFFFQIVFSNMLSLFQSRRSQESTLERSGEFTQEDSPALDLSHFSATTEIPHLPFSSYSNGCEVI